MNRKVLIIVLALATGLIHLVLLNLRMVQALGRIDVLFTLNGLGFLGLLAAYVLPLPGALGGLQQRFHGLLRWGFIAFTVITILAWVAMGDKSLPAGSLGYITKLIEVGLVVALWGDR
jgi:hypothetical protein